VGADAAWLAFRAMVVPVMARPAAAGDSARIIRPDVFRLVRSASVAAVSISNVTGSNTTP
jgi:hypothetical protein